jgi:two-component system osmolarity sensor histidine kinase EnvZ
VVFRARAARALTGAAADIGRGRIRRRSKSGPAEIQTVSRAFNQMTRISRVSRTIALILAGVHDLRTPLAACAWAGNGRADPQLKTGMAADIDDIDRTSASSSISRAPPAASRSLRSIWLPCRGSTPPRSRARACRRNRRGARTAANRARPAGHRQSVDNAFRYGERGLLRVVPETGRAVVEVLDRGPGIPAAEVERLKQPFTRIETETARSGKGGSGLGLAIVDRIARMHGGTFDLVPREGGGLIARVVFPRGQSQRASTR